MLARTFGVRLSEAEWKALDAIFASKHLNAFDSRSKKFRQLLLVLSVDQAPVIAPAAQDRCNVYEQMFPDDKIAWLEEHFPNNRRLQMEIAVHIMIGRYTDMPSDWREVIEEIRHRDVAEARERGKSDNKQKTP